MQLMQEPFTICSTSVHENMYDWKFISPYAGIIGSLNSFYIIHLFANQIYLYPVPCQHLCLLSRNNSKLKREPLLLAFFFSYVNYSVFSMNLILAIVKEKKMNNVG